MKTKLMSGILVFLSILCVNAQDTSKWDVTKNDKLIVATDQLFERVVKEKDGLSVVTYESEVFDEPSIFLVEKLVNGETYVSMSCDAIGMEFTFEVDSIRYDPYFDASYLINTTTDITFSFIGITNSIYMESPMGLDSIGCIVFNNAELIEE